MECSSSRWEKLISSWGDLYAFWTQVGENSPYNTEEHGYTEARLFTNNGIEIEGPHGIYTKQTPGPDESFKAEELGNS